MKTMSSLISFFRKGAAYRHRLRASRQYQILCILVLLTVLFAVELWVENDISCGHVRELLESELQESVRDQKGQGCVMPLLDPFSEEVMKFNRDMPNVVCKGIDWVECIYDECYIALELSHSMKVTCVFQEIIYVEDQRYYFGPAVAVRYTGIYYLKHSDHVKVSCVGKMPIRNKTFTRNFKWSGYAAGFRPVIPRIPPEGRGDALALDVLVLVFDSASHNGFMRRMPKSYKFLTNELGAVVFNSFNVVGDGNSATLFPLLTGKNVYELLDPKATLNADHKFDWKSFIFYTVGQNGYRTAYFEDMAFVDTFQYGYARFQHQPADHYLRPLFLEETDQGRSWWRKYKMRHCMGAMPKYAWMLNLTRQFFQLDGRHFAFTFVSGISHDEFNLITTAEDDLVSFLQRFRDEGWLKNTLLIVMGDHGSRFSRGFDQIGSTYQGKLEERLPFLAVVLPEKLKRVRPLALSTLKANADVLTTPFDIHATLLDVVGMSDKSNKYQVPGSDLPRAMNLLQPIPKDRTCGEAGIVPHWCACAEWHYIPSSEPIYKRAAESLADYINKLTHENRSLCEERILTSILWVMRHELNKDALKSSHEGFFSYMSSAKASQEYYQAKIVVSPKIAVFEGSMTYDVNKDTFRISERGISRVSFYGDESSCISTTNPHLHKYCFCRGYDRTEGITKK